jgi:hypothetical protein
MVGLALTLAGGCGRGTPAAGGAAPGADREALLSIESEWLAGEHDRDTLRRVLADDFVHPVSAGIFLTKDQHIEWAGQHPPPPGRHQRFDQLRARVYGDTGIVTGIVIASGPTGGEDRTIFTDVFVRREGRWQAVSAQETALRPAGQ